MKTVFKHFMSVFNWSVKAVMQFLNWFVWLFFAFWGGFMGGVVAQRIDGGLSDNLMAIIGALWICAFICVRIISAFYIEKAVE